MKICDICKKKCMKDKFPTYVIQCKEDKVLCLHCNKNWIDFFKFNRSYFKHLKTREIYGKHF